MYHLFGAGRELTWFDGVREISASDSHGHGCGCTGCIAEEAGCDEVAALGLEDEGPETFEIAPLDADFAAVGQGGSDVLQPQVVAEPDAIRGGPQGAGYNIDIVFDGAFDTRLVDAFQDAADTIGRVITKGTPSFDYRGFEVDDLLIGVGIGDIDGQGGVLGSAGPQALGRTGLPTIGVMQFDQADALNLLERGTWDEVVLHEMLHVVGVGTIWQNQGLLRETGGTVRFTGENAIAAYEEAFPRAAAADPFSDLGVPVETDYGEGTAFGHWDEETFGDELMTGFAGSRPEFSDLTLASLEDLGYETAYDDGLALV